MKFSLYLTKFIFWKIVHLILVVYTDLCVDCGTSERKKFVSFIFCKLINYAEEYNDKYIVQLLVIASIFYIVFELLIINNPLLFSIYF